MKKDMPLEGLRWSRDSGSALCDTSQNSRSRTGWGYGNHRHGDTIRHRRHHSRNPRTETPAVLARTPDILCVQIGFKHTNITQPLKN